MYEWSVKTALVVKSVEDLLSADGIRKVKLNVPGFITSEDALGNLTFGEMRLLRHRQTIKYNISD